MSLFPLDVVSSQKKANVISLCLKPEMWQKIKKFNPLLDTFMRQYFDLSSYVLREKALNILSFYFMCIGPAITEIFQSPKFSTIVAQNYRLFRGCDVM